MSDVEMVRKALFAWSPIETGADEPLAALSRIAAEYDRLREENEYLRNVLDEDTRGAELTRLREELANTHGGDGTVHHVSAESQAALYAERDRLRGEHNFDGKVLRSMQKERNDAEAENAKLREALEKIAELRPSPKSQTGTIARNALKETT